MNAKYQAILNEAKAAGWVMEPLAKKLFQAAKLPVTRFAWVKTLDEARRGAKKVGYPLVAKIVSPKIVHKSDAGGIVVGIRDDAELEKAFNKLAKLDGFDGVLLDEMVAGTELIVGAKADPQFDTVVLVGLGGVFVEVFKDVAIRMAPLTQTEALTAIDSLKGAKLLHGYRGNKPANLSALAQLLVSFSKLAYELAEQVESIDLNPVFVNADKAVIADARIMLKK